MPNSTNRNDRRTFLKTSLLASTAAAAQTLWQPVPVVGAEGKSLREKGKEQPKLTFVQINDLHVQAPLTAESKVKPTYKQANAKARWCIDAIVKGPQPDFILAIGDMAHGERLEQVPKDLAEFKSMIASLKCPLYPAIGNHEVVQQEGNEQYERPYREAFGDERVNYFFEQGGLLFVVLNNSGACVVASEIIKQRNAWLRDTLAAHPDQKKVLCCHIPIVPVRDEPVLAKSFGFSSYHAHDAELLQIVDEHSKSIVAVLSGHLHLTGFVVRNGVHHISICGTASYPSDYARFALYEDRLEMQVCQLPADLAHTHPSLHGRPRHADDFTDKQHITGESYQRGNEAERMLHISLV
jgi:predicted MPP superfamily phosphohydrolase